MENSQNIGSTFTTGGVLPVTTTTVTSHHVAPATNTNGSFGVAGNSVTSPAVAVKGIGAPFQPSNLDDFAFSNPAHKKLLSHLVFGRIPIPDDKRAICLNGIYGTGKTTLALLLPKLLEHGGMLQAKSKGVSQLWEAPEYWHLTPCTLGINGGHLLKELQSRAKTDLYRAPSGYFYEILDEVDLLTEAAQASLKSVISHSRDTVFIMTTNFLGRLDKGLVDRSHVIDMNKADPVAMEPLGRRYLQGLGVADDEFDNAKIRSVARACNGSLRDFKSALLLASL